MRTICAIALAAILPSIAVAQSLEVHQSDATEGQITKHWRTYLADHSNDGWYNPHSKRLHVTVVDTTGKSPYASVYLLFLARKKPDAAPSIYNYAILNADFRGEPQLSDEVSTPPLGPEETEGATVAGWIAIGRCGPQIFGTAASDRTLLELAKSGASLRNLIATTDAELGPGKLAILSKSAEKEPEKELSASSPLPAATPKPRDPNTVTLTQPVSIPIPYGIVGLHPGTILPLISRVGADKVRVRYDGANYDIPLSATDLH
jgi:hypothetical protein